MNRVLIGNDIFIQVLVSRIGGEQEDFSSVGSMAVSLWHMFHLSNRKDVAYVVSDNAISIRYNASEQTETGWYGVSVTYTKPDETNETGERNYTVDAPFAFELIRSTDYECCPICPASQDEPLELCAHAMLCRDGKDGVTPKIGENGNWHLGSIDTGVRASGKDGVTPKIGENGNWHLGSIDTGVRASGKDGVTPKIGENGNWHLGSIDTGVRASGKDGVTPKIGENGNWHLGSIDTGVCASGKDGADGTVLWPSIRIDSAGMLILDLPDETEGNVLSLDSEGYLCLDLTEL